MTELIILSRLAIDFSNLDLAPLYKAVFAPPPPQYSKVLPTLSESFWCFKTYSLKGAYAGLDTKLFSQLASPANGSALFAVCSLILVFTKDSSINLS